MGCLLFFKTEVSFPFPAIIHGTFDLDGNRNHLNRNEVNEFLLKQLAELMIDTAKQLTQITKQVNWDAMKLLAKKEDLGFETEDENKVVEFLRWIRVEQYPRINKKELERSNYDSKYDDYVFKKLTYPYTTNRNEIYHSYEKLKTANLSCHRPRIHVTSDRNSCLQHQGRNLQAP